MSKTNMLLFFKSLCIFSFLIITNTSRANEASQSIPTLLKQMDHLLQEREIFVTQKEHKLDSLKHQLALSKSLDDKYKLSTKLIEEYKSYICDSALKYIDNSWEIAMLTKENNRLNEVKLQKANLLTTIGLYHETFDILDDIHANELPSELLKQYYHCCEQAYYHMSNYASNSFYENVYKGLNETKKDLIEVSEVYELDLKKRFRYIYLESVYPYLDNACHLGLSYAFKAGIAAEVIGLPDNSIGEHLYEAKIYLATSELFAWTFIIIVVSALCTKIVSCLYDKAVKYLRSGV